MGLLEAALASARSSFTSSALLPPAAIRSSSSHVHSNNVRSIRSITLLSKRGLTEEAGDIEDCGGDFIRRRTAQKQKQKKARPPDSFFLRFKKKTGLSVTDVTATVLDTLWLHVEFSQAGFKYLLLNFENFLLFLLQFESWDSYQYVYPKWLLVPLLLFCGYDHVVL